MSVYDIILHETTISYYTIYIIFLYGFRQTVFAQRDIKLPNNYCRFAVKLIDCVNDLFTHVN